MYLIQIFYAHELVDFRVLRLLWGSLVADVLPQGNILYYLPTQPEKNPSTLQDF